MHPTRRTLRAAAVLAALLVAGPAFAESATLRIRPEAGKTYRYVMTQEQTTRVGLGPMGEQETASTNRIEFRQTAAEVAPDEVTFDAVYGRMRTETSIGGQTLVFDSADEGAPGREILGKLVGTTLRMTMTDRGKITRVEGFDAIFEDMLAGMGDDPKAKPLVDMFRASFNDEAMAGLFQQNMPVLPEGPISEGSAWTWSSELANPAVGTMAVRYDFDLEGFEEKLGRRCARAAMKFALTHSGEFPMFDQLKKMAAAEGQEMDLSAEIGRSEGGGTIWIDLASGMTVVMDSTLDMDMKMALSMPGLADSPEAPPGGKLEMTMAMTTRQKLELHDE